MPRFLGLLPAESSETIFIIIYLLHLTILGLDRRQAESKNADAQRKASWEVGGRLIIISGPVPLRRKKKKTNKKNF